MVRLALTPKYEILHHVTDTQMWFKSMNPPNDSAYTSVEMALVRRDLPVSDDPYSGLGFIDMSLTSDLQRKGEDVTHWTSQEDDKNFGQGVDIDFTETESYDEPSSRQIILNLRPHALTKEKYIVSVEDNHDTLVGFVRVNQEGHVFLTIPFEIEITRVEQVVSIEKGGYRV
jgi:hypothetical protein